MSLVEVVVVVEVQLVVIVMVLDTHTGHMTRVTMMMVMVKVSQETPALKEPRLGSPDSWVVPLHIMVQWSVEKAGGQQQQQQQDSHHSTSDPTHEGHAPHKAWHLGAGQCLSA
jgi:hypothetical protein